MDIIPHEQLQRLEQRNSETILSIQSRRKYKSKRRRKNSFSLLKTKK